MTAREKISQAAELAWYLTRAIALRLWDMVRGRHNY